MEFIKEIGFVLNRTQLLEGPGLTNWIQQRNNL